MEKAMEKLESLLELGGTKKDILFLILSGLALLVSIFRLLPLPFDAAWVAIILCGIPIILEAVIGLVTAFDIKADVLVSLALIASVCIGEDFAAGEVAIIGTLVLAAGLYYLKAEKNDPESKKIYTAVSAVGAVIAVVCALLLFL